MRLLVPQWAKSPKKQSVGVYFILTTCYCILSAELTITHSFRLFFLAILPLILFKFSFILYNMTGEAQPKEVSNIFHRFIRNKATIPIILSFNGSNYVIPKGSAFFNSDFKAWITECNIRGLVNISLYYLQLDLK